MWGDRYPPDIDVPRIFRNLNDNTVMMVICEGCGLHGIGKHEGQLYLAFHRTGVFDEMHNADIHEYIIPKNKRIKLCQK